MELVVLIWGISGSLFIMQLFSLAALNISNTNFQTTTPFVAAMKEPQELRCK